MQIASPHVEWLWNPTDCVLQRKLAAIMRASAKRVMPEAVTVQLTDEVSPEYGADRVFRANWGYDRTKYIPWLMEIFANQPAGTIFADTDVVFLKSIAHLLSGGHDVVLTTRHNKAIQWNGKLMPINLGIAASNKPDFWLEVRDRVLKMEHPVEIGWYGAQLALFDMVREEQAGRGKWNIGLAAMAKYNYTPQTQNEVISPEIHVLHYKGRGKKAWMLENWSEKAAA